MSITTKSLTPEVTKVTDRKISTISLPSYWYCYINPNGFWYNTHNIGPTIIVTNDMISLFIDKVPIEEWIKFITNNLTDTQCT